MKSLRDDSPSCSSLLVLAALGITAASGCATVTLPGQETQPAHSPPRSEQLFPQGQPLVYPGQWDEGDQYLSLVMVMVGSGGGFGRCSGVLIHERLVITAGHCVCARRAPKADDRAPVTPVRKDGAHKRAAALQGVELTSIMDARGLCAGSANIVPASYAGARAQNKEEGGPTPLRGEVWVHPRFELVFGRRGREEAPYVLWSNADLAAILLEQPIPFKVPPLELAGAEVQVGDIITTIGFGRGATSSAYGVRHFGDNQVNRLIPLETGSTVFRAEAVRLPGGAIASHAQGGDSGGACIKKGARNVLVGITSIGAKTSTGADMSIFTSVYSHRSWFLEMVRKAEET